MLPSWGPICTHMGHHLKIYSSSDYLPDSNTLPAAIYTLQMAQVEMIVNASERK